MTEYSYQKYNADGSHDGGLAHIEADTPEEAVALACPGEEPSEKKRTLRIRVYTGPIDPKTKTRPFKVFYV